MSGLDLVISIAIDPPPIKGSLYSEIVLGNQGYNVLIALDFPPGYLSGVFNTFINHHACDLIYQTFHMPLYFHHDHVQYLVHAS